MNSRDSDHWTSTVIGLIFFASDVSKESCWSMGELFGLSCCVVCIVGSFLRINKKDHLDNKVASRVVGKRVFGLLSCGVNGAKSIRWSVYLQRDRAALSYLSSTCLGSY